MKAQVMAAKAIQALCTFVRQLAGQLGVTEEALCYRPK